MKNIVMIRHNGLEKIVTPVPATTYEEMDKYCETKWQKDEAVAIIERHNLNGLRAVILRDKTRKIIHHFKEVAA